MNTITYQQYKSLKRKLEKDVKKNTEVAFRKSEIKNKASALNLALPQYVRYYVIAKSLNIDDPLSLELDQLKKLIRDKVLMAGFVSRIYVSVILTIIDETQYYLLRNVLSKTIPSSLGTQLVKLIKKFCEFLDLQVTEDIILEAFYISNITNIRNLKTYFYDKNSFNNLNLQEKLKHVTDVISHGIAMSYSYEASSIVASYIGVSSNLETVRNVILVAKYLEYIKKSQEQGLINEIQGSKILSIIASKIKDAIIRIISIVRIDKLRYLLRFALETILGPIVLIYLIKGSKNLGNALSK